MSNPTSADPIVRVIIDDLERGQLDATMVACSSLKFSGASNGGDAAISWKQAFPQFPIPSTFSIIHVLDMVTGAEIRQYRIQPYSLEGWDACSAPFEVRGAGLSVGLTDDVIKHSTKFGPTPWPYDAHNPPPPGLSREAIVALRPSDAIRYAMSIASPSVFVHPDSAQFVTTTQLFDQPTRDYILATPRAVIDDMTSYFSYLATPFIWAVRPLAGVPCLSWRPLDLSPKYQITLGVDGVTMDISCDPLKLYNRVAASYSSAQVVVEPPVSTGALDYTRIPIIHTMPVTMSARAVSKGAAVGVAQSILAKNKTLNVAWQYTLHIPRAARVLHLDPNHGWIEIEPWLIEEGAFIRINGMHPELFSHVPGRQPPIDHFITSMEWDGGTGMVTASCGDTRVSDRVAEVLQIAGGGGKIDPGVAAYKYPSVSRYEGGHDSAAPWGNIAIPPSPTVGAGGLAADRYYGNVSPAIPSNQVPAPPAASENVSGGTPFSGWHGLFNNIVGGALRVVGTISPQEQPFHPTGMAFHLSSSKLGTVGSMLSIGTVPMVVTHWLANGQIGGESLNVAFKFYVGSLTNEVLDEASITASPDDDGLIDVEPVEFAHPLTLTGINRMYIKVSTAAEDLADDDGLTITLVGPRAYEGYKDIEVDSEGNGYTYTDDAGIGLVRTDAS